MSINKHSFRFWIILSIGAALFLLLNSCSGSRNLTKTSSKSDSTIVIKTDAKKDSTVNSSTATKTEKVIENDIQSEDSYTEEVTETVHFDTITNKPTSKTTTTKRSGTIKQKDLTKTKENADVKNTTASNYKEDKKESLEAKGSKETTDKNVKSDFDVLSPRNVITAILVLLILAIGYFAYRKFIKK